MKPRTLLILLAAVLGLGAFIWFYERELPSSEERKELEKKVLKIEKDDVTAVTVEASRGRVRLERIETPKPAAKEDEEETPEPASAGEWKLVEPFNTRADAFAVDRLLDSVVSLERTSTLEEVDRKDVGLDKPRATVRLKTEDGEKVLQLGAEVPPGGSLIAGLEGEKEAYVVADTILAEIDKDPGDWRDRLMFRGERDAIQRITLEGAEAGPVVLVRRPNGFWIEKPLADRADREAVDGLLSDLSGLTAEQFADGPQPLAELGLAPPREVIEVALEGQPKPERIELGAPVTGEAAPEGQAAGELTWARASNTVFQVRTRLAESARRAPAEWRAKQLSALEVHDVETATVADGQTSFQLTRSETDWKRGDTLISFLPVSDLLSAVTGAKAGRLLPSQESQALGPRLAKPLFTFTLKSKETGEETLTVYPPIPEGVPARSSGRPTVLLLPKSALQEIQKKVAEVKAAKAVTPAK